MKLVIDEDTASASLRERLHAAEYEIIQLAVGLSDEEVFTHAQSLA